MAKTQHSTLRQQVSDIIAGGATLTTSTNPASTEVTRWLNEGQWDVIRIVPSEYLRELLVVENPSIAAVSEYALSSFTATLVKFDSALYTQDGGTIDDEVPMRLVTPSYAKYRLTNELLADSNSPICWFEESKFKWYPACTGSASTGKIKVTYIKAPTDLSGDSDTITLSQEFEHALVLFAAYKFYLQEEQYNEAQALYAQYLKNLSNIIKGWRY